MITNIKDLQDLYLKRVPKMFADFVEGGAWTENTLRNNIKAFEDIKFMPVVGTDISVRSTKGKLLGTEYSLPLALAPIGMLGMQHADGEIIAAKAAEEFDVPFTLSTMSICSIEDVAANTNKPFWFQLYPVKDKTFTKDLIKRAATSNCSALVVTLDCKVSSKRHRDSKNGLTTPIRPTFRNVLNLATKPRWCWNMLKTKRHTFGNIVGHASGVSDLRSISSWTNNQFDKAFTWNDILEIRDMWQGNLIIKGILKPEDAITASEYVGADAVVVSNHGGRQLDFAPSTISVLHSVSRELDHSKTQVYIDSGIRSGQDILKAIALGADGVMLGRAYVYGLGASGQQGVVKALQILQEEMDLTMALCGKTHILEVSNDLIYRGVDAY